MHIAFVSMPARGHVNPTLPVVAELVRRGHRVSYVTAEKFAEQVAAAGATLVPVHNETPPGGRSGADPGAGGVFGPAQMASVINRHVREARVSFDGVVAGFRADPPDAVCFDIMTFGGRLLAGVLGVPGIALVPNFAGNETFSFFDRRTRGLELDVPELREALAGLAAFAAERGMPAPPNPMTDAPAGTNIVFLPRAFQLAADTFDDRFHFVGPSIDGAGQEWSPVPGTGPLLFVSLGTAMNDRPEFFRRCLEAFGDGAWRVAMAIGHRVDPAALGPVPDTVEVRPYFPQLAVLRRADVFVSHAGMNSTMESLAHGVPLVCVPQTAEQDENARRVEELGLGRRLDAGTVTARELRDAVDAARGDRVTRENLNRMRELIAESGGPAAAADVIEATAAR